MKLEDQVCSLELAKRLKELGVKQESLFYWNYSNRHKRNYISVEKERLDINRHGEDKIDLLASAFTVAELGMLLPECIPGEGDMMMWRTSEGHFGIEYCGMVSPHFVEKNEANARAQMLIWLIENGHVKNE